MFQLCPRIVPEILRVLIFCADDGGPGDKILKVRPRMAAGAHRVLTIEVWHQTSGGKGTNILREVQVGFHLAPADKAGKALAAAVDPAGEFPPDGRVFGVGLDFLQQC